MPKILIIEPCNVNHGDDRGGVHQDVGDIVEVTKDTGRTLTNIGRALYTSQADDADKHGRYTASADMISAAQAVRKAKKKAVPSAPAGGAAVAVAGAGETPAAQ